MKIALLGYGKMGKEIEKISLERGHSISKIIDKEDLVDKLTNTDVAINFSTPDSAIKNIKLSLDSSVPIVSGTTGWLEHLPAVTELCKAQHTAFLYASNFSLGVNLFFELNKKLAKLMHTQPHYKAMIDEIHHTQKKDAPSGTAITTAEVVIQNSSHQEQK